MRRVRVFITILLVLIFDFFITLFMSKPKYSDGKIALIKTDAIGDAIIWLPAAIRMREYFENNGKEVHLFCSSNMVDFFIKHAGFKNVHGITRDQFYSLSGRIKLFQRVRENYFQAIYNVHFSRMILKDDFIAKCAVAEQKIGYLGNMDNCQTKLIFNHSKKYYSKLILNPNFESEILINANFVRKIGIDFQTGLPKINIDTKIKDSNFIAIAPGASTLHKAWQPEYFAKVIKWIILNTNFKVRVFGELKEIELFEQINKYYANPRVKNIIGKTTLNELLEQLFVAKILISNDTGTAHIAGAVGTKTIVILGGGSNNRFFPHLNELGEISPISYVSKKMSCFGCAWKCTRKLKDDKWECVASIVPLDIINILMKEKI